VCAAGKKLKELKTGCKLSGTLPRDEGLQHERRLGHLAVPDLPLVYPMFAHHDCTHNQLVSIHNRVCGKVPLAEESAMARLESFMLKVAKSLPKVVPWDLDRVVNSYHGAKRTNYEEAAQKYRTFGLTQEDAKVKMFTKFEKTRYDPQGKINPDPRAIQYREPVFAVVYAQYIKAIEEVFYRLKGNRWNGLPPSRIFGKGLNSYQRAQLLAEKRERFTQPVVIPLDASRFDQHVDKPHLRAIYKAYMIICYSQSFYQMCSWMITNKVRTSKGIKYVAEGGLMSGDMDTSLKGCFLMTCMLGCYFEGKKIRWDCLDDGDDILLILESGDVDDVLADLPQHFLSLGHEIVPDTRARCMEEVVWCQATPVQVDGIWKFVRNPAKVLSGALVGPRWMQMRSERSKRALANTIGLGEAYLNRGVPVLQAFAAAIVRNANTTRQVKLNLNESLAYKVKHELGKSVLKAMPSLDIRPVTDDTRLSFAKAFNISISEQLAYEEYLNNWEFRFDDLVLQPTPIHVQSWTWLEFQPEVC